MGMETVQRKQIMIAARERGPGPGRYGLPSTVGSRGHDFTKSKKPSYSFGQRLDNSMFSKDVSPGPKYYIDPRMSKVGPEGQPKYSILGRQPDPNSFKTPGPGAYYTEKIHPPHLRIAPRYSMSARTRLRKRDSNPSPNAYCLPNVVTGRSPYKHSSPSYTLRSRTGGQSFSDDLAKTPGPAQYKVVAPTTYKRCPPRYSLSARCFMPGDSTQKPGPGAHYPERSYTSLHRGRTSTMGIRHSEFITPLLIDLDTCG